MADSVITAVMLTQPHREWLACRAIQSFLDEGTPNRQLLVYAFNADYAQRLRSRFFELPQIEILPAIGNPMNWLRHGMAYASEHGGYFTLWNDDYQYAPGALAKRVETLEAHDKKVPAFFSAGFWHFLETGEIFVYDLDKRFQHPRDRMILSTLLCRSDQLDWFKNCAWPYKGFSPTAMLGHIAINSAGNASRPMHDYQWLVVNVGSDNAQGFEAHRRPLTDGNKCMDIRWLSDRRSDIETNLQRFRWEPDAFSPLQLDVCGRDGVAFGFQPRRRWPADFPAPTQLPTPSAVEVVTQDVGQHEGLT